MLIFEVLAVILVVYIMVTVSRSYAQSDLVLRINTAEDLQMMVNTLVGIPGEAIVSYPQNISAFSVVLVPGGLSVFKQGEEEVLWETRVFHLPKGYTAEGSYAGNGQLCLEKKDYKIILRECQENEVFVP